MRRLTTLLITCTVLAAAAPVSADEDLTKWIEKIGRDTPHTMVAMALASEKVAIAADKGNKESLVAGPLDVRFPEDLKITGDHVEYAGRKVSFTPWNKDMAKKPCVALWQVSGQKGSEIIIRASGRAAFLNGRPLQRIRHGFFSAPDGRVAIRLEQEKNHLVIVSEGTERPLVSCMYPAEALEELCRERLQSLARVSPASEHLWYDVLTHLAQEGAEQLVGEGIVLCMKRLDTRSPGSALVDKIRRAVPKDWGGQMRPTLVRKATWLETYKATLRSQPVDANLKAGEAHYIGPFRPPGADWFKHAFAPEKKVDLAAVIEQKWQEKEQTKTRQLKWRPKPESWRDGRINDLRAVMNPPDHGAAYIYKTYTATRAGTVDISAGSDDGLMIWHNGKKVCEADVARGCAPDQELFSVEVTPGKQTFLIKVTQGIADWAFYFEPLAFAKIYEFLAVLETMSAFPEQDHRILQVCERLEQLAATEKQTELAKVISQLRHSHPIHKVARISQILNAMPKHESAAVVLELRAHMPTSDIARILMSGRSIFHLKHMLEGIIARGHAAFATELLAEIETANAAYWQTNSEALGEIYTHLGKYHADAGNFATAHSTLKRSQLLGTRDKQDKLIAAVSVASNSERQLTINPEIEQMFEETRLLIQEKQTSQETCAKLYSFLRKYGNEGLKRPGGLQSAAAALQIELQSRPDLQTALTRYVTERLSPQIEAAIAANDVTRMESVLSDFTGFIDEAPLRRQLMPLCMDRGDFNAVHRHASQLLSDAEAGPLAAAYLMAVIDFQRLPRESLGLIPPALMAATVPWQGKKITLAALKGQLGLRDLATPDANAGPGKQLAAVQLPPQTDSYRELRHPTALRFRRQPLELTASGNKMLVGGPNFLLLFEPATGKIQWQQSTPFANIGSTRYSPPVRFAPFVSDTSAWTLAGGNAPEYQLNAYGLEDGRHRGSSAGLADLYDWQVITPPFGAGGWERVLLLTRDGDTTPTLALAAFDADPLRISDVRPLHRVKDFVKREYKPDLALVRFGAASTSDRQALFATTGCGSLMKIGLSDGSLAWLKTWRESTLDAGSYNATAAGHVSVIGPGATGQTKQIVAYLPELLRWCGLDPDTGRTLWQHRSVYVPTQIHSRSSTEYVVLSTHDKDREPELIRLDPKTGQVLWSRPTNGLDIIGEGVTIGNRIWLPCDRSIAVYDAANGAYLGIKPTPFPVQKIRVVDDRWYLFSDSQLYIFAGQGNFARKPAAPVSSAMKIHLFNGKKQFGPYSEADVRKFIAAGNVTSNYRYYAAGKTTAWEPILGSFLMPATEQATAKPTVIAAPPKTDWHGPLQLVGHLRVPIKTVSGYHGGEWSKSYTRSLPDRRYSLLYTTIEGHAATLCAVVREGARTQEGVQPPQIAWSAALNSPQLHGDHVLTFTPWELQVRNIYDLTDVTRYRIPVPPSTVNSDSPRILGAAWADDGKSIAIHLSSKRVHVIAVPSGKRQIAFDVPGDVSRIDMAAGNVSLSKHGKRLAFAAKTGKFAWEIPSNTLPDSAPYSVPGMFPGMFHGSRIHDGKKISDLVDARTGKLLLRGPGHWACTFRYSGDRFIVHHESAFQKPDGEPMPGIKKCFLLEGGGALLFHDDGRLMWFDGKREQQLKLGSHADKQVKGYWTRGHGGHGKPRGTRFRDQIFFGLSGQELLRWSTVDGRLLESSQALGKGRLLPFEHSLAVLNDGTLSFFAPQSAEGRTAHAEEKR